MSGLNTAAILFATPSYLSVIDAKLIEDFSYLVIKNRV